MQHAFDTGLVDKRKLQGEKHWKHVLTVDDILMIRKLYATREYTQKELGDKFKVIPSNISRIINNIYWRHV